MFGPIAVVRLAGLASCDLACYNVNEIHQETHQTRDRPRPTVATQRRVLGPDKQFVILSNLGS